MEPDLQEFVNAIGLNDDGWTASTNLAPIIRRFTLDVTAKTFCGGSIDAQKTGTQPIVEIAGQASAGGTTGLENAFDVVNRQAAKRIVVGKLNWVMNSKIFKSACVSFSDFAYERVDRAMAAVKGSRAQEHPQAEVEFVKQMAARSDDRELMRDLLIQMLFAGIDGTTAMISFAMLELSRNAGCWDRIRAELEAEGMLNAGPEGITHTKLKACTYLQNVLNETLRLWPPVPINTRQAVRDTVLPVGGGPDGQSPIVVQKGTVMRYSVWIMHRRKDIFGPDALDWKPDHWVGRRMGWEYIPFNGGPRICLGRKFALTEGCYLLARLAQLYDKIEPLIVEPNITTRVELALIPLKGVPVRLHRAETV
jgi:cytochrome P450